MVHHDRFVLFVLSKERLFSWNKREGEKTFATVYNNCDEIELKLNGKSLGRKETGKDTYYAEFEVSYKPGKLETTGSVSKIQANPVWKEMSRDGKDINIIEIRLTVDKTAGLIYDVIHVRPVISRAPGGTSGHFTKAFWQALNQEGYIEVGWNSLTGDADGTGKTAGKEVENIKKQLVLRPYLHSHLVILMHDASGHQATVEALPELIKLLKSQGYTFRVVTTAIPPSW